MQNVLKMSVPNLSAVKITGNFMLYVLIVMIVSAL